MGELSIHDLYNSGSLCILSVKSYYRMVQKQLAFMLGRQQIFLELEEKDCPEADDLTEIMANVHLNNNFLNLAREVKYSIHLQLGLDGMVYSCYGISLGIPSVHTVRYIFIVKELHNSIIPRVYRERGHVTP